MWGKGLMNTQFAKSKGYNYKMKDYALFEKLELLEEVQATTVSVRLKVKKNI